MTLSRARLENSRYHRVISRDLYDNPGRRPPMNTNSHRAGSGLRLHGSSPRKRRAADSEKD